MLVLTNYTCLFISAWYWIEDFLYYKGWNRILKPRSPHYSKEPLFTLIDNNTVLKHSNRWRNKIQSREIIYNKQKYISRNNHILIIKNLLENSQPVTVVWGIRSSNVIAENDFGSGGHRAMSSEATCRMVGLDWGLASKHANAIFDNGDH